MSTVMRWMCLGTLVAAGAWAQAAEVTPVIHGRTVDGTLNPWNRVQTVHAEMQRECGAAPGSTRCRRLKKEFQQEARNCHKQEKK